MVENEGSITTNKSQTTTKITPSKGATTLNSFNKPILSTISPQMVVFIRKVE